MVTSVSFAYKMITPATSPFTVTALRVSTLAGVEVSVGWSVGRAHAYVASVSPLEVLPLPAGLGARPV